MPRKDVLICISDTHIGSTIALVPSVVGLGEDGTHLQSKIQAWLWQKWEEFWEYAELFQPSGGGLRGFVLNGDASDIPGNHPGNTQFISFDPAIIKRTTLEILKPCVNICDYAYMTRGTNPAHSGPNASLEEDLARELGCEKDTENDIYAWWELPLSIQKRELNFCHHVSMGSREWTRPNSVNYTCADIILDYANQGRKPPDLIVRSHQHRYADSGDNYAASRCIITPGWCLKTSHIHRVSPGKLAHIGGLVIEIEDGEINVHVKRFWAERREPCPIA